MVESTVTFKHEAYLRLNGFLTLPSIDEELKRTSGVEDAVQVLDTLTTAEGYKRQIEQVGSAYEKLKVRVHKQVIRQQNKDLKKGEKPQVVSDTESSGEEEDEEAKKQEDFNQDWERKRKRRTKEDIEKEALLMGDLYAILGLDHLTYEAGEGDIKQAYKKLALMYHPDKIGESITQSDKEIWLQVQNAYETLIDPTKRKRYDSSLPFDDSIPSEAYNDINEKSFYDLFEPVFKRNARFAKKKPVPNIGDPTMPMDLVYKFYKYWDNFESWRDFSQYDEYDVREAQDRYERRYMEKENKKMRDKYQKKERLRIIKLVDTAYKNDPRIKAEELKEEQEKQRKKEEIRLQKEKIRLDQEEKVRQQEALKQLEIQKQQEADRKIKEERQALLNRRKESIRQLANLCQEVLPGSKYDKFWAEEFCKKLKQVDEVEEFKKKLEDITDAETFLQKLESLIQDVTGQSQNGQAGKQEEKKKVETVKDNWTAEELSLLSKAIVKYPGALPNRWKIITDHIGTDKTQKQVIAKAQELSQRTSLAKAGKEPSSSVLSSSFAQKEAKKQQQEQVKQKPQNPPEEKKQEPKQEVKEEEVPAWNNDQQKQLEQAMREFPGSIPIKERWIKISEKVEGKSAKECYERFKEICAMVKKQQEAAKQ